jgi:hypothetical protein
MLRFLLAAALLQTPVPGSIQDGVKARVESLKTAGVHLSAAEMETLTNVERKHQTASQAYLRLWRSLYHYPSDDAGEHARLLALWDRLDKGLARYVGLGANPTRFSADLRAYASTLPELQRSVTEAETELVRLKSVGRSPDTTGELLSLSPVEVEVMHLENPGGMELKVDTQPLNQRGQVLRGIKGAFTVYAKAVDAQRKFIREFRETPNVKIVDRPSDSLLEYRASAGGLSTKWEPVSQTYRYEPIWIAGPAGRSSMALNADEEGHSRWSVHTVQPPFLVGYRITGDLEWKQTSTRNGRPSTRLVKTKTTGSVLLRVRLAAPIRKI